MRWRNWWLGVVVLVLFGAGQAHAVYWQASGKPQFGDYGASAFQYCDTASSSYTGAHVLDHWDTGNRRYYFKCIRESDGQPASFVYNTSRYCDNGTGPVTDTQLLENYCLECDPQTGVGCGPEYQPPVSCAAEPAVTRHWDSASGEGLPPSSFIGGNGCEYAAPDQDADCAPRWDGSFWCTLSYAPTGATGTPAGDGPLSEDPIPGTDGDASDEPDFIDPPPTTNTQAGPPQVDTDSPNPGDVTTTTTTTKTESDPKPKQTSKDSSGTTMSDGGTDTTTTTTTTTATSHPDGSATITTDTQVSFQGGTLTFIEFDKATGTFTETQTPGTSTSGSKTTTTTVGSDGSSSTTTTSSGDSDGSGQSDETESFEFSAGAPGSFTNLDAELASAKGELQAAIGQVQSEAAALVDPLAEGVGGLPCWLFSWAGINKQICLSDYEDQLSHIGAAIVFLSLFYAFVLVLRV